MSSPAPAPAIRIADALRAVSGYAHARSQHRGRYRGGLKVGDQLLTLGKFLGRACRYVTKAQSLTEIETDSGRPRGFPVLLVDLALLVGDIAANAGVDLGAAYAAVARYDARKR